MRKSSFKNDELEHLIAQSARRIIFLTGGVCSSVGKGVAISSIASLLQSYGFRVRVKKCDPYLNVDPGTLSPYQHGEVFVTHDGVETDMDLGHYERFTGQSSKNSDYITSGRVYWEILHRERQGLFGGKTVQVVPHVIDEICKMILADTEGLDFLLCEIGGTVGDIEGSPFYESIRQLSSMMETMLVHVAYMPYVKAAREVKSKPVQHSIKELRSLGLHPDLVICRSDFIPENDSWKTKIAQFANIDTQSVYLGPDVRNTYEMLSMYSDAHLIEQVTTHFSLKPAQQNFHTLDEYKRLAHVATHSEREIKIAVVGKYVEYEDSYKSLNESLFYSATLQGARLRLVWVRSEDLLEAHSEAWKNLRSADGVLVPGGFGSRGIDGILLAIQYARENKVPFLGICLGMQLTVIEAARNLCGLSDAHSSEFAETGHFVIDQISTIVKGSSQGAMTAMMSDSPMRLGSFETTLVEATPLEEIYKASSILERFRHRYTVNPSYIEPLAKAGLVVSALSRENFCDALTYKDHPFFVAVQFHPEFLSRPLTGHPLFNAFVSRCHP